MDAETELARLWRALPDPLLVRLRARRARLGADGLVRLRVSEPLCRVRLFEDDRADDELARATSRLGLCEQNHKEGQGSVASAVSSGEEGEEEEEEELVFITTPKRRVVVLDDDESEEEFAEDESEEDKEEEGEDEEEEEGPGSAVRQGAPASPCLPPTSSGGSRAPLTPVPLTAARNEANTPFRTPSKKPLAPFLAPTPPTRPRAHPNTTPAPRPSPQPSKKQFALARDELTARLFREYNRDVLDSQLPDEFEITWNVKLKTTAGLTRLVRRGTHRSASIELSTKVLDCEARLRKTLAHELCHAAAWVVHGVSKPPHGKAFRHWAGVFRKRAGVEVSTTHSYEIDFKFWWRCLGCGATFGRHSKSIDEDAHTCGCGGRLQRVDKDKHTPVKAKPPTPFSLFVKSRYADVRANNASASHQQVMSALSELWRQQQGSRP